MSDKVAPEVIARLFFEKINDNNDEVATIDRDLTIPGVSCRKRCSEAKEGLWVEQHVAACYQT